MIGKTLSFTGSKFGIKNETNKQKKYFFDTKTNFFQLRKIFTREYIKHFRHFRHFRHSQKVLLLFLLSFQKIMGAVCGKVCYFKNKKGGCFLKIKGVRLHPFTRFLSLSSFSSSCKHEALLT